MTGALSHLIVAPVLLPLATAALMLLLGEGRRRIKAAVNLVSTLAGLGLAVGLLWQMQAPRLSASTCRATGRCLSASCLCWTGFRP